MSVQTPLAVLQIALPLKEGSGVRKRLLIRRRSYSSADVLLQCSNLPTPDYWVAGRHCGQSSAMSLSVRIVSCLLLICCQLTQAQKPPDQVHAIFCGANLNAALSLACASHNNIFDGSPLNQPPDNEMSTEGEGDTSNKLEPGGVVDDCCNKPCTLSFIRSHYCNTGRNLKNLTEDENRTLKMLINADDGRPSKKLSPASGRMGPEDDEMRDITIFYVEMDFEPMATVQAHSSPELFAHLYDPVDVLPLN